jgi:hypothetical protein
MLETEPCGDLGGPGRKLLPYSMPTPGCGILSALGVLSGSDMSP